MGQEDVREREDERVVRWMRDTKEGHALKRYKMELNASGMEQRQMQGGDMVCAAEAYPCQGMGGAGRGGRGGNGGLPSLSTLLVRKTWGYGSF